MAKAAKPKTEKPAKAAKPEKKKSDNGGPHEGDGAVMTGKHSKAHEGNIIGTTKHEQEETEDEGNDGETVGKSSGN